MSVIIPTYNRAETIRLCVASLFSQTDVGGTLEIIVVVDGSTDGTNQALAMLHCPNLMSLVVLNQDNRGANAARNLGLRTATAPIVAFLNDDSLSEPGWAAEHLRMHARHPAESVAVLGAIQDAPTVPRSIFSELHRNDALDRAPESSVLDWRRFYTYNLSAKRSFIAGTCFHEGLRWHEDVELGRRLHDAGLHIVYAPGACVLHDHPMTEADYFKIAQREGEALAIWVRSAPELKTELVALGLRSRRLRTRALRHVLADALIQSHTYGAWLRLARGAAATRSGLAKRLYCRLFQWHLRQSIDRTLERLC